MWPQNSLWANDNGFWLSLRIYNTSNGVSKVEQKVNGTCVPTNIGHASKRGRPVT